MANYLRTTWYNMKKRCLDPKGLQYPDYGGRGIAVCARWMDFAAFAADMGERPDPSFTLDRVNNDGNYEPGNCRWATIDEQMYNRRSTLRVVIDGEQLTTKDIAERTGLAPKTIRVRIARGTPPGKILSTTDELLRARPQTRRLAEKARNRREADACVNGHPYTPETIRLLVSGERVCRVCELERGRRYEAKHPRRHHR